MRVTPLPARNVQHARTDGQLEELDETRDLPPIVLEPEDRLVLEQVVRIEVRLPPLGGTRDAGIGSRPRGFWVARDGLRLPAPASVRPPAAGTRPTPDQKNTGSRYAPKTSSIARRIS